jgi:hypothetical protein
MVNRNKQNSTNPSIDWVGGVLIILIEVYYVHKFLLICSSLMFKLSVIILTVIVRVYLVTKCLLGAFPHFLYIVSLDSMKLKTA